MSRLTGFTPSGDLHLGNYFGAIRPIVSRQGIEDTVVFISDLHALTLDHDPADVRRRTLEFATLLLAAGANPDECSCNRSSCSVTAHFSHAAACPEADRRWWRTEGERNGSSRSVAGLAATPLRAATAGVHRRGAGATGGRDAVAAAAGAWAVGAV